MTGLALGLAAGATSASAQATGTAFQSRWTAEPVQKLAPGTVVSEGTSLVKLRLLSDSIFTLNSPFVSADGKWKLPATTELDGMVSDLPVACSQTELRKAKYSLENGSYFAATNICFVDSDRDGAFDKVFDQSGFGLRWLTFEQAVNDSRKNDNRMEVRGIVPADATPIMPLPYAKIAPEASKNILYVNIFYAANASWVGEFSIGFCIDYKALDKSCRSLRPMTFLRDFKKGELPASFNMIGSTFTIRSYTSGKLDVSLDNVPDHHVITIIPNPFNIE